MGILNAFSEWRATNYKRNIEKMRTQGTCPECRGSGINSILFNEFGYFPPYDCPGCNGTGSFTDWAEVNDQLL